MQGGIGASKDKKGNLENMRGDEEVGGEPKSKKQVRTLKDKAQ